VEQRRLDTREMSADALSKPDERLEAAVGGYGKEALELNESGRTGIGEDGAELLLEQVGSE